MVQGVYAISVPVGMGFLQAVDGGLSEEDTDSITSNPDKNFYAGQRCIVSMDYVHGRQCKFAIFEDEEHGERWIKNEWYDHTPAQLEKLLEMAAL
ncbi:MAG: hypothetical protein ACTSYQ_03555 [Candidatus Odinarchaeia archaeon]